MKTTTIAFIAMIAASPAWAQNAATVPYDPIGQVTPTYQPGVGQSWDNAQRDMQQQQQIRQQQEQIQQMQDEQNRFNAASPSEQRTWNRGF